MSIRPRPSAPHSRPIPVAPADTIAALSGGNTTASSTSTIVDAPDLFTALQANRALKEAEYAEKLKFSTGFRGLDEAESEFLEGIAENERRKEEEKREEERRGMELFRKMAEEKAAVGDEEGIVDVDVEWGKKRRREEGEGRKRGILPVKKKKVEPKSNTKREEDPSQEERKVDTESEGQVGEKKETAKAVSNEEVKPAAASPPKTAPGLGGLLGDYGSDSD